MTTSPVPEPTSPPNLPSGPPARRSARPRPGRSLPGGRIANRLGLPPARIAELLDQLPPGPARPDLLARGRHLILITLRRTGIAVPTPVWCAADGDTLYVRTQRPSGKVKRIRRDGRVRLAPSTVRGRPLAAPVPGRARLLAPDEEHLAERALRGKYGPVRALCALIQDLLRVDMCYLAITVESSADT